MKKYLVLVLMLAIGILVLSGCGEEPTVSEQLQEKIPAEISKISIVTDYDDTKFEPWKLEVIEITDPEEIATFQESLNFDNWKDMGNEAINGINSWIVIFNDDVALRFYEDLEHCYIGTYEVLENGMYCYKDADNKDAIEWNLYVVSPEFTEMLKNYVD